MRRTSGSWTSDRAACPAADSTVELKDCEKVTEVTDPPEGGYDRTEPVDIQYEMQRSYIDYAMSVIIGRALPDVRDGLKPVHARILYAMYDQEFRPERRYVKYARHVDEVIGNYLPNRDSANYVAQIITAH